METIFLSIPESKFQAIIIDCVKSVFDNTPQHYNASPEAETPIGVHEAADHLNLDIQTIYRMLRTTGSGIPAHKKNNRWYFFKTELNDWLKSH